MPLTGKVNLTEEQLKGQFWRFDTDGDRRLSKQELNKAFNNLGSSFPAWRTWRALCHVDENGDGYINEEEFHETPVKLNSTLYMQFQLGQIPTRDELVATNSSSHANAAARGELVATSSSWRTSCYKQLVLCQCSGDLVALVSCKCNSS
ncbi:hypothetical protein Patl1_08974 [Pistacia atlantica]|uniref:Uncharacterized protein n=1 Tax=Pistacia atlantica TaxID=434234 RepID=A0ACC1AGQ2_9ROSI|nr:hypothetical protein Patl1_08974 [Pistacia atlantica]